MNLATTGVPDDSQSDHCGVDEQRLDTVDTTTASKVGLSAKQLQQLRTSAFDRHDSDTDR